MNIFKQYAKWKKAAGMVNGVPFAKPSLLSIVAELTLILLTLFSPVRAQVTFSVKKDFTTGSVPYAVVVGDFNNDGKSDIVVTNYNSSTVSVFSNRTLAGTLTPSFSTKKDFSTGNRPRIIATGDLNNDGKLDFVVANEISNTISVFLNTTTLGAFSPTFSAKTDFVTGSYPYSVVVNDLNGDGKLDLAVTNSAGKSVSVFLNTTTPGASTPTFSSKTDFITGRGPLSSAIGDLNGDGKPDLVVANDSSNTVSVFLNATAPGATTFFFSSRTDFTTGIKPTSVVMSDLNCDGKLDVVVANDSSNTVSLFLNKTIPGASTPLFSAKTDLPTGKGPYDVKTVDLNGDNKQDLAVVNFYANSVSVYINTTAPGASILSFTSKTDFTTGAFPVSLAFGDFNGDEKQDLAVANENDNRISVFLNTTTLGSSTLSFSVNTDFATEGRPQSIAMSDLNGDGRLDLAVANYDSNSVSIFLNTTTPGTSIPMLSIETNLSTGDGPWSVAVGDLNGDSKPDLAVTNSNSNTVSVFLNNTTPGAFIPSFSAMTDFATGIGPVAVTMGDLNGDGKPDLAVTNYISNTISVLLNITIPGASSPLFSIKTDFNTGGCLRFPFSLAMGDLNIDGKLDLTVVNSNSQTVSVFLNTTLPGASTPSFLARTDYSTGIGPYSVALQDLNGDGRPDITVANNVSNSVSILLNMMSLGTETSSFSERTDSTTGKYPYAVAIDDLNGDGKPDLAVANTGSQTVSLYLNTTPPGAETPSFSSKIDFITGSNPYNIALGDLNNDGKPDIAVTNFYSHSISVLLNECEIPLPVELTSFTATIHVTIAELKWRTETEINNYGFEVERRKVSNELGVASNWEKIGFVSGAGTSNAPKEYSFIDKNLLAGRYAYRIKQIDRDGTYKYSQSIEVEAGNVPKVFTLYQNYPNPFNPTTVISYQIPVTSYVSLKVYDVLGRVVAVLQDGMKEAGYYSVTFSAVGGSASGGDASKLSTGMYIYRLQSGSHVKVKKLLLIK